MRRKHRLGPKARGLADRSMIPCLVTDSRFVFSDGQDWDKFMANVNQLLPTVDTLEEQRSWMAM
ncbi:hypothetical protein K435DRAFT_524162 [Dendrothele bispora CBS 962.96]|uniref:Uncharacterized protein n=1 Tax=Dendrothele bispora (strain CBS 962.96) TaxID=1314807 RepID=A0A4V4HGF6_DENBC|nr:hypothetical protein K435DRAFT_524162 [Dendrothele bispora CBS 962.96]